MGLKFNLIFAAASITLLGGMWFYIQFQSKEITQLKANAVVLQGEIQKQNESIKNYLETQQQRETQIADLQKQNQASQREVAKLKNTFARHNMDNLALSKPGLIENIVNKGTMKVKEDLIALTDPSQYD
tara:strand:+ start:1490 stop:1876 length:387 start_codon:yes stop_codon:yes gene_type:complete